MAVLFLNPFTGSYFDFTGLLNLDIHEATHVNLGKVRQIRSVVPRVVAGLNVILLLRPPPVS